MKKTVLSAALLAAGLLVVWAPRVGATDISGVIATTVVINEDSQLVGNVTCAVVAAPCIEFGADDIELRLDGFIMTGQANGRVGCNPGGPTLGEDGINTDGQSHVRVLGPGMVRRFRNHGIHVEGGSFVTVRGVTSSGNCHNGIEVGGTHHRIEGNVTVRNSSITTAPCGGIEIAEGASSNIIRRNVADANGLYFPTGFSPLLIDFGIGVFGKDNTIEENSITGNTPHGIQIYFRHPITGEVLNTTGNTIRRNVVMGNPPIQVLFDHLNDVVAQFGAVDIADSNPVGANTFAENLCERSIGGAAAACPNLPKFSGHKNVPADAGEGSDRESD